MGEFSVEQQTELIKMQKLCQAASIEFGVGDHEYMVKTIFPVM